jgi:hypothetical protein
MAVPGCWLKLSESERGETKENGKGEAMKAGRGREDSSVGSRTVVTVGETVVS